MQILHFLHRKELPVWGKSKIGLLTILFCVCLPVSLSAASLADGCSIQQAGLKTTITVQLDQWNILKKELIAQENDLNQLKLKLKMLRSTSSEQIQLLKDLQNELSKTKEDLQNANSSLTECKNELETSRQSLEILKVQIRKLEKKQTVTRRQRDVYATLFALLVSAAIARR